jgi:FK506-binding protein 1
MASVHESSDSGNDFPSAAGTGTSLIDDSRSRPSMEGEVVVIKTIKPGDITNYPKKGDSCSIHYEVFIEHEIRNFPLHPVPFDSSRCRDQVFQFRLGAGQVIDGMDIAVSKMSLGQEVVATIPYSLAYGVVGYPPVVPPSATLIFRIELLRISSMAGE